MSEPQTLPAALQSLLDREAIRDCLLRYCRGIDRCDEEALRSAYWEDATDCHASLGAAICVQSAPESDEFQIPPASTTATRWLPSEDIATEFHAALGDTGCVQLSPEFVEMKISPAELPVSRFCGAAATKWVPFDEHAIEVHP